MTGHAPTLNEHIWTPWGTSQTTRYLGQGLIVVTTASHGGIRVDPRLNQHINYAWRDRTCWYEEDDQWVAVALTFPNRFPPELVIEAHRIAKDYHPDEYEQVFRVKLLDGESYTRRMEHRRRAAA